MPRLVNAAMEDALKKAGEARKYSIALAASEYSGDLSKQLKEFSAKMETVYQKMQALVKDKAEEKSFQKYMAIIDDKLKWFEQAEAWGLIL